MSQPFNSNLLLVTVKFIEEALSSVFVDGNVFNKTMIILKKTKRLHFSQLLLLLVGRRAVPLHQALSSLGLQTVLGA